MNSTEGEPTFHLFEVNDPTQVKATRESLHPEIKARLARKPLRVVGLVISTVANGKPVLISAGGYGTWANTEEEFQDLFKDVALPCSLPWSRTPDFIRAEYDDILVEEGGLSEEKNQWVEIKDGTGAAIIPW